MVPAKPCRSSQYPPSPSPSSSLRRRGGRDSGREGRDAVYVAAVPLRAARGPPQLAMSAAYSLGLWDLQHFMVVITPASSSPSTQAFVFDFQPQAPESAYVALAVLLSKQVPGVVLKRTLRRLPKSRCWFVGFSQGNSLEMADKFNVDWPTNLIVGKHDCRHYTTGLVQSLTGVDHVLDSLKSKLQQKVTLECGQSGCP